MGVPSSAAGSGSGCSACRCWRSRSGASSTTKACSSPPTLNGLTLAALYFLVASGFTLVFGLMRNVNLAHGSLYLLGAYVGYDGRRAHRLLAARRRRRLPVRGAGRPRCCRSACSAACRARTCARPGDHRPSRSSPPTDARGSGAARSTSSIRRAAIIGSTAAADRRQVYPTYRAGPAGHGDRHRRRPVAVPEPHARRHDDPRRRRRPRDAVGLGRQRADACSPSSSRSAPAWRASPAWSAARRCRSRRARTRATCWPRWWWSSSAAWASSRARRIGALLIGLAEQIGLAYAPTYGIVFTFVIMVLVLAFRPQGILGRRA